MSDGEEKRKEYLLNAVKDVKRKVLHKYDPHYDKKPIDRRKAKKKKEK